jgi:GT2 family glycosyltransferase
MREMDRRTGSALFVVIATYNGMKWIEEALNSVIDADVPSTIIVVDNKSTDGTVDFIKDRYPQVVLFELEGNTGFGNANNIGIAYAITNGAKYIYLLNQDARIDTDTFGGLMRLLDDNPEYAIISPMQYTGDGNKLDKNFQRLLSPDFCEGIVNDLVVGKSVNDLYPCRFVMAAHWLVRPEALLAVGGFMPIFRHYGEDDNLILRMVHLGWKVGITPLYRAYHDREHRKRSGEHAAYMKFVTFLVRSMDVNTSAWWIPVWFAVQSGLVMLLKIPLSLRLLYVFKMFAYVFKCLACRIKYKDGVVPTFTKSM